jgi:hypothetical protein
VLVLLQVLTCCCCCCCSCGLQRVMVTGDASLQHQAHMPASW